MKFSAIRKKKEHITQRILTVPCDPRWPWTTKRHRSQYPLLTAMRDSHFTITTALKMIHVQLSTDTLDQREKS